MINDECIEHPDDDCEVFLNGDDNCPEITNGPYQGVCAKRLNENLVLIKGNTCEDDGDCESGDFCEMDHLDSNENTI